jgi:hypothetical protein
MDWKQKSINVLAILGSVTSVTGITALWLAQLRPSLNWLLVIPIVVVAASTFLALAAFFVLIARIGYHKLSAPPHTPYDGNLKFAYAACAIGGGTMLLTLFAFLLASAAFHHANQALGL